MEAVSPNHKMWNTRSKPITPRVNQPDRRFSFPNAHFRICAERRTGAYPINTIITSFTFVFVGPVTSKSPSGWKK